MKIVVESADYHAAFRFKNDEASWVIGVEDTSGRARIYEEGVDERLTILQGGNVGIGTTSPQGALDVSSTTGAFIVPRMTTAQRDALTAVNGMIIYNTTTNEFNFYENGAWVTK